RSSIRRVEHRGSGTLFGLMVMRRLRVLAVLALWVMPLVLSQLEPVRVAVSSIVDRVRGGGAAGVAVDVAAFLIGAVITAPVALFSGIAGYSYGPLRGLALASPASVVAATTAFLVGRFLLSERIARSLEGNSRWAAVHRAVSVDAFRVALLLRV